MKKILLTSLLGVLFSPLVSIAAEPGYLTSGSGVVVKNNFGNCWNTSATKIPNAECGDVIENAIIVKDQKIKPLLPRRINDNSPQVEIAGKKITVTIAVLFKFDSSVLSEEGKEALNNKVVALNPIAVEIIGHTDIYGSAKYNLILSEKRAKVVKDYLIEKGIKDNIIATKGVGKSDLACSDKTKACNAENRRSVVKAEVLKKD